MKILLFTNNSARHISFAERLSEEFDEVFVVQETNTLFPGKVDDFFRKSETMQRYFVRVLQAEEKIFGRPRFLPANLHTLALRYDDVSLMPPELLGEAAEADAVVVFGASYIKNAMVEILIQKRAVNVHMGLAPWYRGHSCNFWAVRDGRPDMVGATVHRITRGLDSGSIVRHAMPKPDDLDPFVYTMRSVAVAHEAIVDDLLSGQLTGFEPVPQDKSLQLRYSRGKDFTDEVAAEFLDNEPAPHLLREGAEQRDLSLFLRPFVA